MIPTAARAHDRARSKGLRMHPVASAAIHTRGLRVGSVIAVLVGLASLGPVANAAPAPCQAVRVGTDSTAGTVEGDVILGKAWGQSFVAIDTLLLAATVCRIPSAAATPSAL